HVLSLRRSPPSAIPTDLLVSPPRMAARAPSAFVPASGDALARRVAGRLARLPRLAAGQGRSRVAFNFAAWLVRDLGLADEAALPWLVMWDSGNTPPLGESDLRDVIHCAREYGRNPVGCGVPASLPTIRSRRSRRSRHHSPTVIRFTVR